MSDDVTEGMSWQSRKSRVREKYYAKMESPEVQAVMASLETRDEMEALAELTPDGTADEAPTSREATGSAPGPDAIEAALSERDETSPSVSTVTSATDTAPTEMPPDSPASTMPAESTSPRGGSSTVLTISPVGLLDSSTSLNTVDLSVLLGALPAWQRESLRALATGRREEVADTVREIAKWFVEEEDERAELPLVDALRFYLEQYRVRA